MKKVNDADKNAMLGALLAEGEQYTATAYMNTIPSSIDFFSFFGAIGAVIGSFFPDDGFSRRHNGYVGVTNDSINFAILNMYNVTKLQNTVKINFSDITNIKVNDKKTYANVNIWVGKKKYSIQLPKKLLGAKLENQAENASAVAAALSRLTASSVA